MASMKEIKGRMESINDIMKITNAMYLISSSKLKKARKQWEDTRPYFQKLQSTIKYVLRHTPNIEHHYLDWRKEIPEENRKRGYILVTADKGLAGAYNHNVIKFAETEMSKTAPENIRLFVVGQAGYQKFSKSIYNIDMNFNYTVQNPTHHRAREIGDYVIDLFEKGELDEVYVIYTRMVTAAKAEPRMWQILPLYADIARKRSDNVVLERTPITYSPSPEKVLDCIVPNYIHGMIYGALMESFNAEQYCRMTAMDSATKSAKDMISFLSLTYNRARQAAITQEITEIAGGAAAAKKN